MRSLENEASIAMWYLAVMEQGVDTKEIVKEHAELQKKYDKLKSKTSHLIEKLENELKKTKKDLKDALE